MNIVVCAEERVPASLKKVLDCCGVISAYCHDHSSLEAVIKRDQPDIVLLYLPSPTALQQARTTVKSFPLTRLFVISDSSSALERVLALQSGVHNYYMQPFSYTRLVYDIGTVQYQVPPTKLRVSGPFTVDLGNQTILYRDTHLPLSKKQYRLMSLFLSRSNQVVSRVQIWESVWGLDQYPLTNSVDALVSRLRYRLPKATTCAIERVYGIGYRLLLP